MLRPARRVAVRLHVRPPRPLLALLALVLLAPAAWSAEPTRRTLAVSYFDNNSGDATLDPLAKGLADMLITDLQVIPSLQLVERAKLNEIMKELDLSRSKLIDPKTALQLGKGLSAAFIMAGGYLVANDDMRIDVRIFQVDTGKVIASEKIEGPKGDFFALEKDLVQVLVKAIGVDLGSKEKSALRRNPTESFEAFQQYSHGLALADNGDTEAARAAFQAALAADPGYQAARDAIGRLKAIFKVDDEKKEKTWEQSVAAFKTLDPKAPDYGQRLFMLFSSLSGQGKDDLKKEVELLQWLQDQKLEPRFATTSPVPFRALGIAFRLAEDPDMEDAIFRTCEYFIGTYPNDEFPKTYCRSIVTTVESYQKSGTVEERRKRMAESLAWSKQNLTPGDWRLQLIEQGDAMKRLIRGYAARVKP